MKKEYSAGIIVYSITHVNDKEQRLYLLLQYPRGYWGLSKGNLEPEESALQAAQRELKEETGLDVKIHEGFERSLSYMFKDPQGVLVDKTVTFFVGESATKEVVLSYEHQGYSWLPYKDALKKITYQKVRTLLIAAEDFIKGKKK